MPDPVYLSGAVEGPTDESAFRRIVAHRGGMVHRVQVPGGKPNLRRKLAGYNAAGRYSPWLVLVDLDQDFTCAAAFVADWLPSSSTRMRLRVVVRQLESWLLADAERFAQRFQIARGAIAQNPDQLPDAKEALLTLVGASRSRAIRDDMTPRAGSGRRVGPAYASRLIEFIGDTQRGWRPDVAATRSRSLAHCLVRLDELLAKS